MNELLNKYSKKINDLIDKLKDQVVVFDFDGTLIEIRHAQNRLLPCKDKDLDNYAKNHNIYANVTPLAIMQYIVNQLMPENVYVLTVSKPNVVEQKQKAILHHYPHIIPQQIIHVPDVNGKYNYLNRIHELRKTNLIFVDDTLSTLLYAEENMDFINAIHISSFMI